MLFKKKYKIFFAIPFDAFTHEIYKGIIKKIQSEYRGIECALGKETIAPNSKVDDIQTFKSQNAKLFEQFVRQIREADIVVADLTNNNPNVHVELGIAMSLNKNILRVCGRDLKEVGFDVSGFDIDKYKDKNALYSIVNNYLRLFFKIKQLGKSSINRDVSYVDRSKRDIVSNWIPGALRMWKVPLPYKMKDFYLSLEFKIIEKETNGDWFGVMIRASTDAPFVNGVLINSRWTGATELTLYPKGEVVKKNKLFGEKDASKFKKLEIEVENDVVKVYKSWPQKHFIYEQLKNVNFGSIFIMAYKTKVEWKNLKIVCRDTINPDTQYL